MRPRSLFLAAPLLMALPWACATLLPEPQMADVQRASAVWPSVQLADLREGRNLYMENCAGCHALHPPGELDQDRWERIMVKMQRKAKIDDGTRDKIMRYLLTFAKSEP